MVGASTFKLLSNLVAPQKPGQLYYSDVLEKLQAHFMPKPIKITERFRYYSRQQLPGETLADYFAELHRLASTCEFGTFLDEALCDRFVCGLKEEGIQRRLLAEADLTLEKAFKLAVGMEAAEKNVREIQSKATGCSIQALTPTSKPQSMCYLCLGKGHLPAMCQFKLMRCNKCQRIGHHARACKTDTVECQSKQFQSQKQNYRTGRKFSKQQAGKAHHVGHEEESSGSGEEIVYIVHNHACHHLFQRVIRSLLKSMVFPLQWSLIQEQQSV